MSTRDELAHLLAVVALDAAMTGVSRADDLYDSQADALVADRWRKVPDRVEIARAIASGLDGWNDFDAASQDYRNELLSGADAVLALMAVDR